MAKEKPNPSAPILFSLGTFTSIKETACVSLPLIPNLFSLAPIKIPAVFFSIIKALIPFGPFEASV